MRKIRLDIEELAVESFDTERTVVTAGTVRGNDATVGCPVISQGTCFQSCSTGLRPCIEPYC